jgi:hypothetical protein
MRNEKIRGKKDIGFAKWAKIDAKLKEKAKNRVYYQVIWIKYKVSLM